MNILVAIYNPAELFPPTINAVEFLAKKYQHVTLVTHSLKVSDHWDFPENVQVIYAGRGINLNGTNSYRENIAKFIKFTFCLRRQINSNNFDIVLLYEPHAILSYRCATIFKKPAWLLWYHNHDIFEIKSQRKYSIGWWAVKSEIAIFPALNIFSLPAVERLSYFPMDKFQGEFFFLPNFPSKSFFGKFYKHQNLQDNLRLIYQGRISEGHGLEQIIPLLGITVGGKRISLHLKGMVETFYKDELIKLAARYDVQESLIFYGVTAYAEVPKLSSTCNVGIGIHTKTDIMHLSLGTSSNKTYEYIAVGLPVLLFDNPHFRKHLSKYSWAIFTDCTEASLIDCLKFIINNFETLSLEAYKNFNDSLNFEIMIERIHVYLEDKFQQIKK